MEITINLDELTYQKYLLMADYYKSKKKFLGETDELVLEEFVKGSVELVLSWIRNAPEFPNTETKWDMTHHFVKLFNKRGLNQSDVTRLANLPASTVNGIWKGSTPNLESFIRMWIVLGKPPIEELLTITPI